MNIVHLKSDVLSGIRAWGNWVNKNADGTDTGREYRAMDN